MAENNLQNVLEECRKSAAEGYKIASLQEKNLSVVLHSAEDRIQSALLEFNASPFYSPATSKLLESQLTEINSAFDRLAFTFQDDLNALKENLSKFSITLFGRTMAGKSTLMEILTEGDGSSIGKGAQRTTVDVREYQWNGLEVTDVPGIGAFSGEDDEQIAFNAAKKADLILFLITDDAPQAVEAECFSRIVDLGKPVIGIMNVKKAIQFGKSLKFNTREVTKQFDIDRLNKIMSQFFRFSEQYGQTWNHIPFVFVHLQSAFLSQHALDEETKTNFYEISRIDSLKDKIIEVVAGKGEFYRIKTFIDIISNPVLETMENLLDQSQMNSIQGRTIQDKKQQLVIWKSQFQRDGKAQIRSLILKLNSEMNSEIAAFVEDHFADYNADKAWMKVLKGRRIETRCRELLEDFGERCNDKLREVSREITNELKFATSLSGDRMLRMHTIIDGKRAWSWTNTIVGGGLAIAWGISSLIGASATGPLGIATIAVAGIGLLGSYFFESREKQEQDARISLEKNLRINVAKMCDSLQAQMEKSLDSLVSVRLDSLIGELDKIQKTIISLAGTQKEFAWELDNQFLGLNRKLLTEAIRMIGAEGLQYHVQSTARIPGNSSLILLKEGTVFPEKQIDDLNKLMTEKVGFAYDTNDKKCLISCVIGGDINTNTIQVEEDKGIAYVQLQNITPYVKNKVRLAQQFSHLLIINQ